MYMLLAFLLSTPSLACSVTAKDLRADVSTGLKAYDDWDWQTFDSKVEETRTDISCLTEGLQPADIEKIDLLFAYFASRAKGKGEATYAFRGVLAVNAAYEPPLEIAAPGSPLREAYDLARKPGNGQSVTVPVGPWIVDGKSGATSIPLDRATLVQYSDGTKTLSWYLAGKVPDSLTPYLPKASDGNKVVVKAAPPVSTPVATTSTTTLETQKRHPSRTLALVGGGIEVLAAAGLYAAWHNHEVFLDPDTRDRKANEAWDLNHFYGYGGYIAGGVGAVTIGTSFVVRKW